MSNNQNNANGNKGFITLTVVFEAMSLNRDESMGNIQSLHLLTRGNNKTYSYMSRQALTYAVRKFLIESGKWPETPVQKSGDVTQYETDLEKFPEIDLFGYMETTKGKSSGEGSAKTRPAAVTFTHAISLEPYNGDMAFYANPEMARRSGSNPNPYNRQEHKSLYKYSVVIDLARIGIEIVNDEISQEEWDKTFLPINDPKKEFIKIEDTEKWRKIEDNNKISYCKKISEKEKNSNDGKKKKAEILVEKNIYFKNISREKRIIQLLDAIASLSHQIMAYREPLNPLFIAAAHLKFGTPIFHNYVELKDDEGDNQNAVINRKLFDKGINHAESIKYEDNRILWGILEGAGDLHLKMEGNNNRKTPQEVITEVKNWVEEIYKESNG